MARAHFVKKARKDYPQQGIKRGDSYYWWKFRFGGKHFSKAAPRRSQLTQSDFYSQLWEIEDNLAAEFEAFRNNGEDAEELRSFCDEASSEIEQLGEEQGEKHDNMPDQLQDSGTGELLQERADRCSDLSQELQSLLDQAEDKPEKEEKESEEDYTERLNEWRASIADLIGDVSFDIE